MHVECGKYSDSFDSAENAFVLSEKYDFEETRIFAQYAKAWALFRLGQLGDALPIAKQALQKSSSTDRYDLVALCQNTLGAIYKYLGSYQQSEQHQRAALELFRRLGDRRRVAGVLNNLGETARLQHDYLKAYELHKEVVETAEVIGEMDWMIEFLSNLGKVQITLKKYQEATVAFSKILVPVKTSGAQISASHYVRLATALLEEGQMLEAVACLTEGQQELTASGADEEAGTLAQLLSQLEAK